MSPVRSTMLVAWREVTERARRRSSWLVFAVLLLGSTAAAVVPELIGSDDPTRYDVAVVGTTAGLPETLVALGAPLEATITVRSVADVATAERLVDGGEVDLGLVPAPDATVIVRSGTDDRLVGAARQALATVAVAGELGVDPVELDRISAEATPAVRELDASAGSRRGAAFAVSLVLYVLLLSLMVQVSNGVAIEKSSRISEVLLPIVRPSALLFGKVLGVTIGGAVLLAAGMVPIAVKLALGGDVPEGIGGALLGGAAWFVLGLAFYLILAGALGALVERPEDAGSSITPLTLVLVATFIVAQSAADSRLGVVLAYVPLTSPLIVPTRLAVGASSPAELAGSLVVLVGAVVLVAAVGARVYRRAVVRTGQRVRLRQVLGRRARS